MAKGFPNVGCTVGLASDRTALTSPFTGQQFFETDTKLLYVYDGSAWVSVVSTSAPPAMVWLNTSSFTSLGTTGINVDNVFSSTYNNYRIMVNLTASSAQPSACYIRLRYGTTTDSGNYYRGGYYCYTESGVNAFFGGTNSAIEACQADYVYNPTSSGIIELLAPYLSTRTLYTSYYTNPVNPGMYTGDIKGYLKNNTQYTGFNIYCSGGNINGTVSVYGYRM